MSKPSKKEKPSKKVTFGNEEEKAPRKKIKSSTPKQNTTEEYEEYDEQEQGGYQGY